MSTAPILLTGAAGYIGSHVAEALLERGHAVVAIDSLETGHRAAVPAAAEFHRLDLRDAAALDALFAAREFAAVMHFAGHILVGESMSDPFKYLGDNVAAAATLLRAATRAGVGKFVFSSTANLFAETATGHVDESAPIAPSSPYGESKAMVERQLAWAERIHGLRFACLRYFNAAGAHPRGHIGEDHRPETHLIPIAIQAALGQRPTLQINGEDYPTPDGTCIRDYVHVLDLAAAHIRVLDALDERSVRYNLGTGRGHSVREVAAAVGAVAGRAVPVAIGPRRPGDPPVLVADPSAIRRELGWTPRYTELGEIIETAWRWHHGHPRGFGD